jgi:glycosyltransferase involved in cell wall biosynthesis
VTSAADLVAALEAAMVRLAASPALRRRLGEAAAAKVQAEYNWKTKADRIVELYAQALRSGRVQGKAMSAR